MECANRSSELTSGRNFFETYRLRRVTAAAAGPASHETNIPTRDTRVASQQRASEDTLGRPFAHPARTTGAARHLLMTGPQGLGKH